MERLGRNKFRMMALAICLFLLNIRSISADGILRDGVGAISMGRGGTNLGFADNGNILLDNPGSLVNIDGNGLVELDVDLFITDLTYQDPDNAEVSAENSPFPMGQFSMIRRSEDGNYAWGLGAFSHGGFSPKYTLEGPAPFSGPQIYKSVGAMMRILPGVSVALTPRWSVGATLGVAVSHTELEGPYFTQLATPFQGTPTYMDLQGTGAGLSWSVGTQYQLSPTTILGASFQGETHIDADGSTTLTIPGFGVSRYDLELETQWPSTLGVGILHTLSPCSVISADVIWTQWSAAKTGYGLTLTNPSNPIFAAALGPVVPERFPLAWNDSVAVRLGYQRFLGNGRVIRTGYVYHPNPIPDATLTPFIQSIVEHTVSVGYGWQTGPFGIDLAYQYMFGPDESVGTSGFVGGDFDNSVSSAAAHWISASLIRRF